MTSPLGSELGHLATPAHATAFDDVRLVLLDALVAAKAAGQLGQESWEEVFGAAVRSLRLRVIAEAETAVRAAAAYSRYPARRLAASLPDADAAEVLLHKMLAEGSSLEQFEGLGDDPATRRARAAALDAAWDGVVRVATTEAGRWRSLAMQVAAWRRPMAPVWIISAALWGIGALLAGWLSGEIPSPHWFEPVNDLWWRLWP